MTIAELRESSNKALSRAPMDVLVLLVVVLASSASFGLGYLAGKGGTTGSPGIQILERATSSLPAAAAAAAPVVSSAPLSTAPAEATGTPSTGKYVASKNGTKYYLPSCSGAKRIKEENKVWFATVADATAAGLTPASNCPGL